MPIGVLGCLTLGSFFALEIAISLSFPNRSRSGDMELQNSVLGEIRRDIKGKNGDSV